MPEMTTILDLIDARLAKISKANGYSADPSGVHRCKLTPYKGYDLPSINFWPVRVENQSAKYSSRETYEGTIYIEYHDMTRDTPFSTVAERLAADVLTALDRAPAKPKVSDAASYDLGGAVTRLSFRNYSYQIGEGQTPWCGVLIEIAVKWETARNKL
jgi:hypothetical protein